MEQSDLLRYFVAAMERLSLRYFVTGSVVTVFYGEPRFTNDIDVVVDLSLGKIAAFCEAFPPPEYYVSEEAVREAIATHGQFNIIHPGSGLKVDVILPHDTAYDRGRFARLARVKQEGGLEVSFSSPEDVILKKMQFYREGGSDKHVRDIASMLKISGERINRSYIVDWATRLGLEEVWNMMLERARKSG